MDLFLVVFDYLTVNLDYQNKARPHSLHRLVEGVYLDVAEILREVAYWT